MGHERFVEGGVQATGCALDNLGVSRFYAYAILTPPGKTRAGYLCASQSSDHSALAVGTELHQYEAMIDIWCVFRSRLQNTP